MKSVVLCEGPDDLWFIGYYLYKVGEWKQRNSPWKNYTIPTLHNGQKVISLEKGADTVAVWCVGGKDAFSETISVLLNKIIGTYPFDPVNSIVIMRDRDNESDDEILSQLQQWVSSEEILINKSITVWSKEIDGIPVSVNITPLIIPFSEEGAIETVLMHSVSERDAEGAVVVDEANSYIAKLCERPEIGTNYLTHERQILKARYASTIAVTNPGHSTSLFQDMVMACPWEESPYVKEHFDVILRAISS